MQQPRFVLDYQKQARALLKNRAVYEPSFSRGTYQIEVVDKKNTFFPFLQLTDEGDVTDAFCSCKLSEKSGNCPHLAAAYLRIFNQTQEPLHVRFKKSLWNRLFQIASKRHGYDTGCLTKRGRGRYSCYSKTKKQLFSIRGSHGGRHSAAGIYRIERIVETEETSIKFSNLSPEQILQMAGGQGQPFIAI